MSKRIIQLVVLAVLGWMQVLAQNEFDPQPPGNPGANYWYSEKGEVVVDDFKPGNLSTALNAAIGDADPKDVLSIVVAGIMNNNDIAAIRSYENCTLLDLSRCTGISEIIEYSLRETKLETVYLPATIERISRFAFGWCDNLKTMSVYALTPPELNSNAFYKNKEGMVVYVPAAALQLYMEAEGWKDFTILPIQKDIRSLTVSLPQGTNVKDYEGMWMELQNTKNDQSLYYVMTDTRQYTFNNIIYNTTWDVTLRNERGDVFGQIKNVEVHEKNVSVAFDALSKALNVALKVTTPEGQDVTSQTQVSWTDVAGNYLSQKPTVSGLPEGLLLNCKVTLPQDLAMVYNAPATLTHTVSSQLPTVNCQLSTIPAAQLSGTVTDAQTGLPLDGAIITATQTFGAYTKTLTATTAADGTYALSLSDVPTSVTIATSGYLSQTINNAQFTMHNAQLLPLTGAVINLGYTFTPCAEAGERGAETEKWYNDYQNIDYTVYNVTMGCAVSQFQVQYPQMVLMEDVGDGEVLRLTATSRTNRFLPVTCEVTIADQQAKATFDIVELGKIQATVLKTTNAAITATLYDGAGHLVASRDYTDAKQTFEGLTDGEYTLLSMGKSELFNTIGSLDGLSQTKLTEGTDYVLNSVTVQSGITSVVSIAEVPLFDEGKLYYTGEGTSFTVNKSETVAGNYVTLTGRLDFKAEYAEDVSQVQLIVDIPEKCQFVENSVMVGNNIAAYTLNGQRLTVPVENYTERIRFCVIPTNSGSYTPNAFVQFGLDSETITQPIGKATVSVSSLTLSVPPYTNQKRFFASGMAQRGSKVSIYDGDVLIGQATPFSNGSWTASCELSSPTNLSTHYIVAKITTVEGVEFSSETASCVYDEDAVMVSHVKMYHNNQMVDFDFQNPSNKEEGYTVSIHVPKFTYTIEFTKNDTTLVSDVELVVETSKGEFYSLEANYDEKQGLWVAVDESTANDDLPVDVSVDYVLNTEGRFDPSRIRKYLTDTAELDELKDYSQRVETYFSQLSAGTAPDDLTTFGALIDELMTPEMQAEEQAFLDSIANLSDAEIDALLEKAIDEWPEDMEFTYSHCSNDFSKYHQFTAGDYNYLYRSCEGVTLADVPEDSHVIPTIYGDTIYVCNSANRICYIDFAKDVWCEISHSPVAARRRGVTEEDLENILNWEGILADEGILKEVHRLEKVKADRTWIQLKKDFDLFRKTKNVATKAAMARKLSAKADYLSGLMRNTKLAAKVARIGKAAPVIDFLLNGYHAYEKIKEVEGIFKDQSLCKDKKWQNLLEQYKKDGGNLKLEAIGYHSANFAANTGLGAVVSALAVACPMSLFLTVPALFVTNLLVDDWYDGRFERQKTKVKRKYEEAMRKCLEYDKKKKKYKKPKGGKYKSGSRKKKYYIDPSGFVYEAVESNRLEGVTATIYQKQRVEDMYGEWTENVVKWNAEEYGQENPLFTDAEGNYRWDVPDGQWQVTFEKQGYETARSEWLPVPPPQLDINIAMHQNVQPVVRDARAYEDAVVVEFDKYMKTALLTTENIRVLDASGEKSYAGAIELIDEEDGVAMKARFKAVERFGEDEVMLIVSNRVMSYAGIRMQDDFTQVFTVGGQRGPRMELRQVVCDSVIYVGYGEPALVTVTVLPIEGAAGQILKTTSQIPMIVGVETEEVVLDENGSAQIAIFGNLPGAANLTFSVEECGLKGSTLVNVEETFFKTTAAPTASIASGVYVDKGTEIRLSCTTEDAVIYYTLDGSCPCEDTPARKVYDGTPIVINETTTITMMAAAKGYGESSVVEYTYFVGNPSGIVPATVRFNSDWRYNLHGQRVDNTYKGIVITNGKKVFINK